MPMANLLDNRDFYYGLFGDPLFVRPNTGYKLFTGTLIRKENLSAEELGFGFYHNGTEDLVVVSSSKQIEVEWRFIVANKKIIAGSQYKLNRELEVAPGYSPEAFEFASKMISEVQWEPDPLFVLDICQSDGKMSLLEMNAFSASGHYDCQEEPIVSAAKEQAIKEWQEIRE
jgi:hypothetical protein